MPFKEREYNKKYQKQMRQKRKLMGVCSIDGVGIPVRLGGVCQKCLDHSREVLRKLKLVVIAGYGGKCQCCGTDVWEFLSIDHVYERGADERRRLGRKSTNSASLYRKIIRENFPPQYQILCFNCNMSLWVLRVLPTSSRGSKRHSQEGVTYDSPTTKTV